jgi:hypothetical protein
MSIFDQYKLGGIVGKNVRFVHRTDRLANLYEYSNIPDKSCISFVPRDFAANRRRNMSICAVYDAPPALAAGKSHA